MLALLMVLALTTSLVRVLMRKFLQTTLEMVIPSPLLTKPIMISAYPQVIQVLWIKALTSHPTQT